MTVTATWVVSVSGSAGIDISIAHLIFSIGPGELQDLIIEVDVLGLPESVWAFGEVLLVNTAGPTTLAPDAHLAITLLPDHLIEPTIGIAPASLAITLSVDHVLTDTLALSNSGIGPLNWTAFEDNGSSRGEVCDSSSDIPWLSVSPTAATTPEDGSDEVIFSFDSTGLLPGSYAGTLCFSSNDLVNPTWAMPISLEVRFSMYISLVFNPP